MDEKTWEVSKVWIYFGSSDICVDLLDLFQEIAKKGEAMKINPKNVISNKQLGPMLIEAAWVAIYKDYALACAYGE